MHGLRLPNLQRFATQCGDLNINGTQRLICLCNWLSVVGTVWEGLGDVALLKEGVSLGVGFEISKMSSLSSDFRPKCEFSAVPIPIQLP